MILCNRKKIKNIKLKKLFKRLSHVSLTKLSNYFPYLLKKHIALIKIDIEGAEGKAIEGGIEIITQYHVPFIFIEFSPNLLKEHGTNPKKFLELFSQNGYKISLIGFLSNEYISV